MYMTAGHPIYTHTDTVTKPDPSKPMIPDVELPLYKYNRHVPKIGDMDSGYTAIGGWMFEAVGRVVDVERRPGVNHPDGTLVWVEPIADRMEHFVIPYHTPELAMFTSIASWNWDIPSTRCKPLPRVGEVADGIRVLPDGICFVRRGRVIKVQEDPYRVVFIEPESPEHPRSEGFPRVQRPEDVGLQREPVVERPHAVRFQGNRDFERSDDVPSN
ncbi:hypothetical protein ASPCAL13971 [Aspergillus calidoustus]|uniref:Uncharacterized protein n=1 Tax=Aspergillus calidoustus TaxID=454130 RepID=A0A0U5GLQ7_ASPCI|nr:hypothetical protein ASPCAL13971 [Aspergillus calidoustus]